MKPALCVAVVSVLFGVQLAHAVCRNDAVFVAIEDQIRGYSLRENGPSEPCQVLQGPHTTLTTARAMVIDKKDSFHVAQFLTNGSVDIFPRRAQGNEAPSRTFMFQANDLVSIAVDSHLNDYVLIIRPSEAGVYVVPNNSSGPLANPIHITDPNIAQFEGYVGIAIDSHDNLLIAGYDIRDAVIIDTLGTSRSITSPPLIRSLTGPQTGLLSARATFARNNITIAVDPRTDELFVYNANTDLTQIQVSVFAAKANGDVPPVRTISGPATGISGPAFAGMNKIAVSSDGRLFVAEPNGRILAFAPGAKGNVAPSQVIQDSTSPTEQGGLAIRSEGGGRQHEDDDAQ